MKKFLSIILTLALFSCLTKSCSSDDTKNLVQEVILSTNNITIPQQGGESVFYVKSNIDWTLTGATDWCSVSPTSGVAGKTTKLILTATPNQSGAERTADLLVNTPTDSHQITVKQLVSLYVEKNSYIAKAEGEVLSIKMLTDGKHTVKVNHNWIQHNKSTRATEQTENFSVAPNYGDSKRIGTITISLNGIDETITIEQENLEIPSADISGVESNASQLASKMIVGWNIGNSLESTGNEVAWGNPATTKGMIDMVKAAGFNSIRIPCNWMNGYVDDTETCQIKASWLNRVKEVVDYCVENDMYTIINIHWDGGWLENNPTYAMQQEVNRKQALLWKQIASFFRDYDEHLLFAGTNEVHVEGIFDNNKVTAENHEVQQSFNQTFVDAVRATGGRNAYRNLIIQSYNTNIDLAVSHLKMPNDNVENRLMMEVHCYDPWDYAGEDKSKYWGEPYKEFGILAFGQEAHFDSLFAMLKTSFADKGIPVIMGEYGANRHSMTDVNMVNSRAYYLEYVTRACKKNGIIPFVWDNGRLNDGKDEFGLFNRKTVKVHDQAAIDAIIKGAKE